MKQLFCLMALLSILTAALLPGCSGQTASNIRLQDTAMRIQKAMQKELDSLDAELASAAKKLSVTGLTGTDARKILLDLYNAHPLVVDCSTTNQVGRLVTIMPQEYSKFEGSDISTQEHVVKLFQTRQPILSHSFKSVEGFYAVALMHPVFSDKGDLIGAVDVMFRPEALFEKLAKPEMEGTGFEKVWAMQTDGLIIFDYDAPEIGTNLFTDPLYQPYTELLALGQQIVKRETGCGGYQFLNLGMKEPVKKQVCWSSTSLRGVSWRIIVTQVISK